MSLQLVRVLADRVERAGVPQATFLRAAGLDAERLEAADARMPLAEHQRLCELAIELTADPALGLHWAESFGSHTFAPLSHLVAHSANMRAGLESAAKFARLLCDVPGYLLLERGDRALLRAEPQLLQGSLRVQRFVTELALGGLARMIRAFDPVARLARARFTYPAPEYQQEYARLFRCELEFEQPCAEIEFDAALLATPSRDRDRDISEAMQVLAERRMARLAANVSYASRVRERLLRESSPRRIAMRAVARALGMSPRTLRRQLACEGTSYAAARDEALAITARHLLRERQLTIKETAYELGFSSTATFHRAFKRWTGQTPSAFRTARSSSRLRT